MIINPNRRQARIAYSPGPLAVPQFLQAQMPDGSMMFNTVGGETVMEQSTVAIGAALLAGGEYAMPEADDAMEVDLFADYAALLASKLLASARAHDPFFQPSENEVHHGHPRPSVADVSDSPDSAVQTERTDQERGIEGNGCQSPHD